MGWKAAIAKCVTQAHCFNRDIKILYYYCYYYYYICKIFASLAATVFPVWVPRLALLASHAAPQ